MDELEQNEWGRWSGKMGSGKKKNQKNIEVIQMVRRSYRTEVEENPSAK